MMSGSSSTEPGVTTLRIPDNQQQQQQQQQLRDQNVRDIDIEVCFVCKKCRAAFSGDSSLLTHQRQCFGGSLDNRGAFRVVQCGVECKLCPSERFRNLLDYRKHSEGDQHLFRIQQQQQNLHVMQQNLNQNIQQHQLQLPPPSESPLSHEMEDVVNQITLLAARAAQEAGAPSPAVDSNSNTFCQPGEPKRRFLNPGDVIQPLTSAGH